MQLRIEDYALIGNRRTAALVGNNGSIDWLGFPRFDSEACFAAILGTPENGRWLISPKDAPDRVNRRYREGTLILETEFETKDGAVLLTDCMQRSDGRGDILRVLRCTRGRADMQMDLRVRFSNGEIAPALKRLPDGRIRALGGPDQIILQTTIATRIEEKNILSDFEIRQGEEVAFSLTWDQSWVDTPPSPHNVHVAIEESEREWKQWSARCNVTGEYAEAALRSLITLRALTDVDTGGIVAAPTTSLPEQIGGSRNWDYRYCWLRDSTFTLLALIESGYREEAEKWRKWLVRSVGGSPEKVQILYGISGERRIKEFELEHLKGYMHSKPVHVGNGASEQMQLDVYGELLDCMHQARRANLMTADEIWELELGLAQRLLDIWKEPDHGMWEVRGGTKQFVLSKVMVWVAFDRMVKTIEEYGAPGPVHTFRHAREEVRKEVENKGFDEKRNTFLWYYGGHEVEAGLLLLPIVGFLPASDARIRGTVAAIEQELMRDGLLIRYKSDSPADGLKGREGVFLACSFWLVDVYELQGRHEEARRLFERVLALRNDVGLLSEEYDTERKRLLGNFPQGLSHLALVNSALNLTRSRKPAQQRAGLD